MSRFVGEQPGITSWHSFSAGAHYDPDNISFGPVIGLDEHLVAPGAGFDWHGHRGVHIVSRVLEGTLRHEDSSGAVRLVGPGEFLVQSTGDGVRHTETNASSTEPLRFLQLTLLGSRGAPTATRTDGSVEVEGVGIRFGDVAPTSRPAYVFDVDTGSDLRLDAAVDQPLPAGPLLVVAFAAADGSRSVGPVSSSGTSADDR